MGGWSVPSQQARRDDGSGDASGEELQRRIGRKEEREGGREERYAGR